MINMFITNDLYWSFYIFSFMFCPEPPLCISSVGSWPVQYGRSLTIFLVLLGVGNWL